MTPLEDIEKWIEEHGWDDKYFDTTIEESARSDAFWLEGVMNLLRSGLLMQKLETVR
jgi:hypothetical protein